MLDGLLLPAASGTSRDRVLTVVAYEVGSGLGHVHEDAGEKDPRMGRWYHPGKESCENRASRSVPRGGIRFRQPLAW